MRFVLFWLRPIFCSRCQQIGKVFFFWRGRFAFWLSSEKEGKTSFDTFNIIWQHIAEKFKGFDEKRWKKNLLWFKCARDAKQSLQVVPTHIKTRLEVSRCWVCIFILFSRNCWFLWKVKTSVSCLHKVILEGFFFITICHFTIFLSILTLNSTFPSRLRHCHIN